jgi:hypothetical protein
MSTILAYLKKRFENCAKILPDKRNLDHLEFFSKHVILEMEDKLSLMSGQLSCCVEELKREDNKLLELKKKSNALDKYLN